LNYCVQKVSNPANGGLAVFIGTVRNHTKGKEVIRLDFEAYEPMAKNEMQKIAEKAMDLFDISHICIHHRIGSLQIGEIPVIITVGSAHRAAAFDACRFAIDTLKETVPIWKKEVFEDGTEWVAAHP
jgi:molybdopterin synthase catalytic subunit